MPEVVLRNPNLPGQPFVLPVGADGVVPFEYKAAGFEIDAATSPDVARAEAAESIANAERSAVDAPFHAEFAPDPSLPVDPPADVPAAPVDAAASQPTTPTPVAPSGPPADTTLEH